MKMTAEIRELLDIMEKDFPNPMQTVIVGTDAAYDNAVTKMKEQGKRLAAVSNAGLPEPLRRLTFLPDSAFTDSPAQ